MSRSAVALLVSYLTACADAGVPTDAAGATRNTTVAARESVSGSIDAFFVKLGGRIPSFAGTYVNSRRELVVALTDLQDSLRAGEEVRSELRRQFTFNPDIFGDARVDVTPEQTVFRKVLFTFTQLAEWRALVYSDLLSHDRVLSIDIDEVDNRITVGVANEQAASDVVGLIKRASVPFEAFSVVVEAPTIPASINLQSRQRPLTAGFVVGAGNCTIAGAAMRSSTRLLLTASHCTAQKYNLDYGSTYQGNAADPFGFETTDPSKYSCGTVFSPKQCRRADVAAYNVDYVPLLPVDTLVWSPGLIAKTLFPMNGLNQASGSKDVDPNSPYWFIQSTANWPLTGWTLHKVGLVTGWTFGDVIDTCKDKKDTVNNVWIVCSDLVNMFVEQGDSGSPVFLAGWNSTATFVGIAWGKDPGSTAVISNYNQMTQDLGTFSFW